MASSRKQVAWQKYYTSHREHEHTRSKARRTNLVAWLAEYKKNKKCKHCGENHPACLDFHHRDPAKKDMSISQLVRTAPSMEKLLREIAKCDILCANCHRKEHYKER